MNADDSYKKFLLQLVSEMEDEEFEKVVKRFEKLHSLVRGLLEILEPFFSFIGLQLEPEAKVSSLCLTCAKPCEDKSDETQVCDTYKEFVEEKCPECIFWDLDICTLNTVCREAEHFEGADLGEDNHGFEV